MLFKLLFPKRYAKLAELEIELSLSKSQVSQLRMQNNLFVNQREHHKDKAQRLQWEVNELTEANTYVEQRYAELDGRLERLIDAHDDALAALKQMTQEIEYLTNEKLDLEADLDDAINEKYALEQEASELRGEKIYLLDAIDALQTR